MRICKPKFGCSQSSRLLRKSEVNQPESIVRLHRLFRFFGGCRLCRLRRLCSLNRLRLYRQRSWRKQRRLRNFNGFDTTRIKPLNQNAESLWVLICKVDCVIALGILAQLLIKVFCRRYEEVLVYRELFALWAHMESKNYCAEFPDCNAR